MITLALLILVVFVMLLSKGAAALAKGAEAAHNGLDHIAANEHLYDARVKLHSTVEHAKPHVKTAGQVVTNSASEVRRVAVARKENYQFKVKTNKPLDPAEKVVHASAIAARAGRNVTEHVARKITDKNKAS